MGAGESGEGSGAVAAAPAVVVLEDTVGPHHSTAMKRSKEAEKQLLYFEWHRLQSVRRCTVLCVQYSACNILSLFYIIFSKVGEKHQSKLSNSNTPQT